MGLSRRGASFLLGKVAIDGSLPLPTGAALETTQSAVKTAVEALAAIITGGSLKTVLTAGTAAFGKLSANTAATYIGDVVLQAGTAAIGKLAANDGVDIGNVDVPLAASVFDVASANATTGAGVQLGSQACTYGAKLTNLHASQILYVGGVNVSATRFIVRVMPGETSDWIPVSNTNLLYVMASGASTNYVVGGC